MKSFDFGGYALGICTAVAMLTGCGGSQPPIGVPGAMPQSSAITSHADINGSWVLPEAATSDLLYIGGNAASYLAMYTYPKGKLVGVIKNPDFAFLAGECIDAEGAYLSRIYKLKRYSNIHMAANGYCKC